MFTILETILGFKKRFRESNKYFSPAGCVQYVWYTDTHYYILANLVLIRSIAKMGAQLLDTIPVSTCNQTM